MGSALSSFLKAHLDKAEVRRLMAAYPHLRGLPAEEREDQLRWLMNKDVERQHHEPDVDPRLQEIEFQMQHGRCRYLPSKRQGC